MGSAGLYYYFHTFAAGLNAAGVKILTDSNGVEKATGSQQSLGKDDFLKLLITKMQFQDPLNPMEDEDYIAQLAQFSTLEQMNNIAEGFERKSDPDFARFLDIAKGSNGEVRSMLYLAEDLHYIESKAAVELRDRAAQISAQIGSLIKYLDRSKV